jgi:DNA invertase Pin-like site-specific DNA recombinase
LEAGIVPPISGANHQEVHLEDQTTEVAAAAVTSDSSLDGRTRSRKDNQAERKRLHEETSAAADRIAAEAHAKVPRPKATAIGAIYVRFSTLFQDSAVDQIRELYQFAVENKIFVPREYVFFDLGVRGYKNQRGGLDQLRAVLAAKRVQVLLLFATNRLFRKVYLTLQFVEQAIVENGIRCVFVKSGVDTANKDQWQTLLHMRAMMDEFQVRVNAEHIRAALEGMFLDGLVRGTLPLGYKGEPIGGKLTKRGRSRSRIVVDCEGAKLVFQIFEWFVDGRLSLVGIAQRLNSMSNVSKPRNSNRWTRNSVRAVLTREAYRGVWKFSVTERKFLTAKDYTRQIPREKPLNEVTFENLRIVADALWFAAQRRLAVNTSFRGRKAKNKDSDPSIRILSGLCWCPDHNRPLRAYSAQGQYLGCPVCATLEPGTRPLFSKPRRNVVLRLLYEKLAELIRQDENLLERIISAAQAQAAALQRPDESEIKRLEKSVVELTRKIDFNMRNPGETEEDEQEIAETLRNLRRERQNIQNQLGLIRSAASEPARVPTQEETRQLLDGLDDILRRAAAGQLGDDQDAARDILEMLTGGRIDLYQQGERKPMHGWLQGRFTVKLLDVLVEKVAGMRRANSGDGIEVAIDFKLTRKTDTDADEAIRQWLDGRMNKEIAENLQCGPGYVSRLVKLGAQRLGATVEALQSRRKTRPAEPSKIPKYKAISDEVKVLWWDELYPVGAVADRLACSTVTVDAAKLWWYESRDLAVPTFEEWSVELERRVLELFDADELTIGKIANRVHRAHGTVMLIVKDACRRLGRPFPDARIRRGRLTGKKGNTSESAA